VPAGGSGRRGGGANPDVAAGARCGAVQDEQKKRQAKRAEDEADGAPRKPATSEPRKVTRISSTAVVAINIVYL